MAYQQLWLVLNFFFSICGMAFCCGGSALSSFLHSVDSLSAVIALFGLPSHTLWNSLSAVVAVLEQLLPILENGRSILLAMP